MATTAKRLRLRCFLEGVEVPVIAANVQVAPNSPMLASIQIPPLSEATRFKPRTLVHLFFLDFWPEAPSGMFTQASDGGDTDRGPATLYDYSLARQQNKILEGEDVENIDSDMRNYRYKLLFGGEIVGFEWVKIPSNRSIVLQCQDWSNYWDYAMQFKNTDLFGPGYKAMFSGGSTNLFTDFLETPSEVIIRLINQKSVQYPKLEGLLGGLIHLLEAIGGAYYTANGKTFAGQNIFFSIAELRLRITQMLTAYDKDPSAKRLMGGGYDGLFGRTLGNLGDQVSFRKALNALMGVIFHEVYPQPCPLFIPGTKGTISRQAQTQITQDPSSAGFLGQIDSLIKGLQSVWAEEAPDSAATKDKIKAQRTHILKSLADLKKACSQAQAAAERLRISKASKLIVKAKTCIGRAENKTRTKWKQGATVTSVEGVHTDVVEAINTLKQIKDLWVPTVKSKNALPARLNQQVFRPDVWFSAPPRCNVIFPEHFFTLNYRRDFLQEPTRLMLKTNDEFFGEDELFDCFYFAPKLEGLKSGGSDLYKMLQGDILAHEVFTGIMPVFEKMGEFNIFGIRSGSAPQADKKDKTKKLPARKPKIGLAQRSTNFLFFRYRFGARAMSIQGVFNPYIACGFPGLIIDKYVDLARLKKMRDAMVVSGFKYRPLTDMLGTHFLGNFSNVVHSLSQSEGGRTEIQVQFPREYNEDLEYLGASNKVTREVEKKLDAGALRETDVAAIDPPPFGALGPNFGPIASVKNVTSAYTSAGDHGGQTLPVYGGPRRKGTGELTLKVPIGVTKKASAWGPDIESAVGDPNKDVTFRAYRVKEMVPRYRQEKILMPAEELIRPGWYGDCWHPSQIGKVYEQFFRTGAITDPQQVSDPSGAGTYVGQEGMDDALSQAAAGRDPEDPRSYAPAIMSLEQEATIQQAVSFLLQTYSYIRMNDLSADDFIRSYTWRPIASIVDMFGSSDLEFDARGEKVVKGIEGFHSRAFGPYSDLFNLVTDEVEKVLGVTRGSRLAKKVDTRRAKFDAVQDYVQLLMASRAILG